MREFLLLLMTACFLRGQEVPPRLQTNQFVVYTNTVRLSVILETSTNGGAWSRVGKVGEFTTPATDGVRFYRVRLTPYE